MSERLLQFGARPFQQVKFWDVIGNLYFTALSDHTFLSTDPLITHQHSATAHNLKSARNRLR